MTVEECKSLNQSELESKQTATIVSRNQEAQASLANINASLVQTLNELTQKYQTSSKIANSGSILVGVLTITFVGLIIANDLARAIAFLIDSNWMRGMLNYLEVREMQPAEMEPRWKRPNAFSQIDLNCASQVSNVSLMTGSRDALTSEIADHDPKIRVQRYFKPIGISIKKTPPKSKILMPPIDV